MESNLKNKYLNRLSGFTDEASPYLEAQIKLTQELGWQYISARTVGDANIHEISDEAFEKVVSTLEEANLKVAEFGSLIGNWAKHIKSDFDITKKEIERCIPRMKRLGVSYVRVMSYAQEPWGEDQYEKERFKRLNYIVQRFKDEDLTALHENCMNWGGFSAEHTLRLLDEVADLQLVFDTGNPIFQRDRSKEPPYPWQSTLEFYHQVKHAIAHVHVKDAVISADDTPNYTFAGEGHGHIKTIIADLMANGYEGLFAIEPHMGKVFHDASQNQDDNFAYNIYKEYAQRFEKMVAEILS
ncbi:sugar phosphate isomerase/epimerase family protein [Croceivirga thetidis]|uniref:Sugar phosphate isomerase/epimerase n=1 Tax=Croceivirga thetidis TaxID=2721623 RepID=A0ABX1GLE0_9FLAO|nr:sugar phosphate isomerase/epimerase family protein [Croceivirga thetidis]NKI30449.1 sugar phosphate isomerase/epimerase [Croceivirga thetidis]